jgi:DNA-binding GntR family transcriptional regulator
MKPTPEMIEAAAKEFARKVDQDDHTGAWDEIDEYDRDFYREAARFAIEAAFAAMWSTDMDAAPKNSAVLVMGSGDGSVASAVWDSDIEEWRSTFDYQIFAPATKWAPIPHPEECE